MSACSSPVPLVLAQAMLTGTLINLLLRQTFTLVM